MSMMNGSRESLSSDINVTPMIDVLLVLLIIFMVVSPHHFWGEEADLPRPAEGVKAPPDQPLVIQLHDTGQQSAPTITINHNDVAWPDLDAKLREVLASRADRVAFLKGDPEIYFEYVAQAVDAAHQAGADRVGLLGAKD